MADQESDSEGQIQPHIESVIGKEISDVSESSLQRSENVQLLIALGVLGLAGTLFAQDLIAFPLLESASESNLIRWSFRILVYSTILFLFLKLATSTFYPGSESRLLIIFHEQVTPFGYMFASSLFLTVAILVILQQNTPLPLENVIIVIVSTAGSLYIARKYSQRTASAYENLREAEAKEIEERILWELLNEHAWGTGVETESLINFVRADESRERIQTVLDNIASSDDFPIEVGDNRVTVTDRYDLVDVLKARGFPESELRVAVPDYIKDSPTANPKSDEERIFYCHTCKKHFAESEMSALQVQNRECPECAQGLSLFSSPEHRRR